ncbi:hypothetical protein H206_05485 [Candidatus Electrothrix aarhusensis]|uniref:Uncharacterized protein n=1 Tax=Candidatus Electrothrix aarhusensis TaxID=1859131 RepID=A0A444J4C9_9BACT|nr:hypothetical protein H206_05485 [Candidatus Electrothrix aarhusensis]
MQTDAGFVQDVEYPGQPGADLGGQPNPLGLAAGQGSGLALQREIAQAYPVQESQPLLHLLEHGLSNHLIPTAEFHVCQLLDEVVNGHPGELDNRIPADQDS